MSKSAALSTRVKHLSTRQSIDLKVDALHPQLYLLTPSQPNQKLFSYLPQIFANQNEQLQHYQIQLVDQITYTGSYNDELAYDSLLEDWQGKN